jgi:hypothetical protein
VELLQSRKIQLQELFNDRNTGYDSDRSKLIQKRGAVFADAGTTGWGLDDDDDAGTHQIQHMSTAELRQQQQRMVQGLFYLIFKFVCSHLYIDGVSVYLSDKRSIGSLGSEYYSMNFPILCVSLICSMYAIHSISPYMI